MRPHHRQPTPHRAAPDRTAGISRRDALRAGGLAAGTGAALALGAGAAAAQPAGGHQVFAHGVVSGDPAPNRVVIWTRVTPSPDATPGSGAGAATPVRWEVSASAAFDGAAASGTVWTSADSDHTVKVDVAGLAPATTYYYRFTARPGQADAQTSPVGRTRTAPAADAAVGALRFGVVSCSYWEAGFFSAYRHLAARGDLDFVVHLGDYLYEYGRESFPGQSGAARHHEPAHEILTLADYRVRHAQYKTDPDLMALHAQVPWIVIWDDHESANDAWRGGAENHDPAAEGPWAARAAAARKAYLEWMPVRTGGSDGRLYRRLRFGTLAEFSMVDLRTYRDQQAAGFLNRQVVDDPGRSITGPEQMAWLTAGVASTPTRWCVVGNPVMVSPLLLPPLDPATTQAFTQLVGVPQDGLVVNSDQWDGYPADRRRLFDAITASGRRDVVFLTGDIHTSWASNVPRQAAGYPGAGTVGVEFVVPSVTSSNIDDLLGVPPRTASVAIEGLIRQTNQHVQYVELDSHGYTVAEVTPEHFQVDWFFLDDKTNPATGARHAVSYRVRSGAGALEPAPPLPPRA